MTERWWDSTAGYLGRTQKYLYRDSFYFTEERKMILWFSNEAALTALTETSKCISVTDIYEDAEDLPGNAIDTDITSIKNHFEDDPWMKVLAKGDFQSYKKLQKFFGCWIHFFRCNRKFLLL